jgi:hypothetical protein
MSSRDIQRVLQEKNVNTSLTTVRKAIDAAGFVSTKPRYCQLIRDVHYTIKDKKFCCSTFTDASP